MYKGASPFLLDGFKTYLIEERESRFKWKKLIEETEHDLGVLFSEKSEASCYRFLSMPARATPTHIGLISNGIHKLEEMYAHVVEDEKVMQKRHNSIFSKNKLKRWAEEQNTYDETSLQKLAALKDTISEKREQLCKTKKELERVFKSMPSSGIKKGVLSRKRKEGKSKAKRRKRRRLENNKEYITSKIFNTSNCTGITISKTM